MGNLGISRNIIKDASYYKLYPDEYKKSDVNKIILKDPEAVGDEHVMLQLIGKALGINMQNKKWEQNPYGKSGLALYIWDMKLNGVTTIQQRGGDRYNKKVSYFIATNIHNLDKLLKILRLNKIDAEITRDGREIFLQLRNHSYRGY